PGARSYGAGALRGTVSAGRSARGGAARRASVRPVSRATAAGACGHARGVAAPGGLAGGAPGAAGQTGDFARVWAPPGHLWPGAPAGAVSHTDGGAGFGRLGTAPPETHRPPAPRNRRASASGTRGAARRALRPPGPPGGRGLPRNPQSPGRDLPARRPLDRGTPPPPPRQPGV